MKQKAVKRLALLLALCLTASLMPVSVAFAQPAENTGTSVAFVDMAAPATEKAVAPAVTGKPAKKRKTAPNAMQPDGSVLLTAAFVTTLTEARIEPTYEDSEEAVVIGDTGSTVEWTFTAVAGDYEMEVLYYPVQTNNSATVSRVFTVNGDTETAQTVGFQRRWVDDVKTVGTFEEDSYGNQIRPLQIQEPAWLTARLYDAVGATVEPVRLTLQDGVNVLTMTGEDDSLAIARLRLIPYAPLPTYAEKAKKYAAKGCTASAGVCEFYEAEQAVYKSDSTLYPTYERSSASVTPHSAFKQQVNIIGGSGWKDVGQYIVWNVDAPADGLYALCFKYRKNVSQGISSYRRLYIDGTVPFAEANSLEFSYVSGWKNYVPGGEDDPYLFYLTKGTHTLKLEVNLGDMTGILEDLSDFIYDMNSIYRRIIVVTGASPDLYRDYDFATILPDVVKDLHAEYKVLCDIYDRWFALVGEKGQTFSTMDLMKTMLVKLNKDPELIARSLAQLKSYIGSCGTLLNDARAGQLELDGFTLYSPDQSPKPAECGFFEQLWFSAKHTFSSYITDYNTIGTINTDADLDEVRVWVTTGRDQYELLKNMANNGDLEAQGVKANLQLVSASLLQAIIAGTAPDVQLTVAASDLINYALRGAMVDVSKFDDFEEVSRQFYDQTFVPLTLENKVYGLPVTMSFDVLFYRTDILSNLGVEVPQTWDDVTRLITVLNKNNLEFGLPATNSIFYTLLMQSGGRVYNQSGSKVAFDDQVGVNAFIKWTRYFTDYGQPLSYDAQNRFRSGEMPLLIADYGLYNTLAVAAPEINGLWAFAPVPGTEQEDGSIDRSACLGSSASAIIKGADNEEAAWTFLKWWTSEPIQMNFGRGQESLLGSSARYATANLAAMNNLPWTASQKRVLTEQLGYTKAIPEVPGGYLTTRELTYAFYKVVNQEADQKDTLLEYVITINKELTAKRSEFGLTTAEEEEAKG